MQISRVQLKLTASSYRIQPNPLCRRKRGYNVASFDKTFLPDKKTMDFLSAPGYALLSVMSTAAEPIGIQACPCTMTLQLRLVLHTILCLAAEGVVLMGPCCSSWGIPSRGTSLRSFVNSLGAVHLSFVAESNVTIARPLAIIRCYMASHW